MNSTLVNYDIQEMSKVTFHDENTSIIIFTICYQKLFLIFENCFSQILNTLSPYVAVLSIAYAAHFNFSILNLKFSLKILLT